MLGRMPTAMTTRSAGIVLATVEAQPRDTLGAQDGLRLGAHAEFDAALFQRRLEQRAGRRVELPLHQRVEQVHDRHVHALQGQPVRGFEAQQSAADDHRATSVARRLEHALNIVQVAERDARPADPCPAPAA